MLGFQAVTPVFDGATEEEIQDLIEEANEHDRRPRRVELNERSEAPPADELFVQ